MDIVQRYLALLTLAESSEAGRLIVQRMVIEAASRAQTDLEQTLTAERAQDLMQVLAQPDEWPEECASLDAFEYRFAQIARRGGNHPFDRN